MAVVQNTLIGKASGSVGNVTFLSWRGINVLKSKPTSVANPRTPGQTLQRGKLTMIVMLYRAINNIVNIGYAARAIRQSAYNAFVKSNIRNIFTVGSDNIPIINYALLKIAQGTIQTLILEVKADDSTSNIIALNYTQGIIPIGATANDNVRAVAYNATNNTYGHYTDTITIAELRSLETLRIPFITQVTSGDVIHIYTFIDSAVGQSVSDSHYITYIIP